ncbi:MAG: hypothetical protein HYU86_07375 [Chloroflexi bacterium]|nr:hypothetical protein [Chloroflexota bacterium]
MAPKAAAPKGNYEPPALIEKTQDDFLAELAHTDSAVAEASFAFNASPACSAELTRGSQSPGVPSDSAVAGG